MEKAFQTYLLPYDTELLEVCLFNTGQIDINGETVDVNSTLMLGDPDDFNTIYFPNFLADIQYKSPIHYRVLSSLKDKQPAQYISRYTETWDTAVESLIIQVLKDKGVLSRDCPTQCVINECMIYSFYEQEVLIVFKINDESFFLNENGCYVGGNASFAYGVELLAGNVVQAYIGHKKILSGDITDDDEHQLCDVLSLVLNNPASAKRIEQNITLHTNFMLPIQLDNLLQAPDPHMLESVLIM